MLVNNTNLPSGFHYANANAKTSTYHIPNLPAPYQITNTRIPGMFFVWYGSPYDMTQAEVEADVSKVIGRLRSSVNPTAASTIPNFVEFRNHTPFKLVVSADAISGGFYHKLEGREWFFLILCISDYGAISSRQALGERELANSTL